MMRKIPDQRMSQFGISL